MRSLLAQLPQLAVMAAIVATLAYVPLGLLLVLGASVLDIPIHALVTIGGTLHPVLGLLVGWLVTFAGSLIYAICVFPWPETDPPWLQEK